MPDGRVLLWSDQSGVTPRLWNPIANGFATVAAINTNLAGSAQAGLADGTLAIVGGHDGTGAGTHDAHRYDAIANTWTSLPFLLEPRNLLRFAARIDTDRTAKRSFVS